MYLLEVDSVRHRVHVTLAGTFCETDAQALLDELTERLAELKADFHVLCDLTALEDFEKAARPHYRAVMELCSHSGARKVIRIIPDPLDNFGVTIMSHIHYDSTIPIINCKSMNEARKHF
ncbi:hypothetical protein [Pontiella sp.]|uniref:hypothetical protein n=1 Tax=Pontiella sp. TaxID=2837462 RepID=UPI003562CC62